MRIELPDSAEMQPGAPPKRGLRVASQFEDARRGSARIDPRESKLRERRAPLPLSLAAAVFGVATLLGTQPVWAQNAPKPNILFILSDDHSYPFVGCYGDSNVRTPNLDRFAAEGMRFHRFFTTAPQCVPSRASYLTGRSPVAAHITRFSSPLPRDVVTFPEVLKKEAGYYVGVVGRSYHLDGSMGKADGELGKFLVDGGFKTF